jgi:hypothetical protein
LDRLISEHEETKMSVPRKPGSQVAPGQRPLYRDAPTALTHSKVPIHQATAGRLYRVRDKDWVAVWAENLTWDDANRLKEQLVAQGRSRTARAEDMEVEPPDWYRDHVAHAAAYDQQVELGAPGHATEDPELEQLRAPAVHASASAAAAAQQRADRLMPHQRVSPTYGADTPKRPIVVPAPPDQSLPPQRAPVKFAAPRPPPRPAAPIGPRIVPRDRTIQPLVMRTAPPPRDKTVASEIYKRASAPPAGEPQPLISPLVAAMMPDDPIDIPDEALIGDADVVDIVSGVGGAPSDEDLARAKHEADAQRRGAG